MEEFNYTIVISGEELLSVRMNGTWEEAYEIARGYNTYGDTFTFYNLEGEEIISLSAVQLMNDDLKIIYLD